MSPAPMRCLVAVWALMLGACSSYPTRWREAKAAAPAERYAGAWKGRWTSERHPGSGGDLWCILTPLAKSGDYRAEFHATWHKVFSSNHEVVLHSRAAQNAPGGGRESFARDPAVSGESEIEDGDRAWDL